VAGHFIGYIVLNPASSRVWDNAGYETWGKAGGRKSRLVTLKMENYLDGWVVGIKHLIWSKITKLINMNNTY